MPIVLYNIVIWDVLVRDPETRHINNVGRANISSTTVNLKMHYM